MPREVDAFLHSVVRTGLLRQDELEDALRVMPSREKAEPTRLARHLVLLGKLSRFQAQKLLQGATVGLRLGPYVIHSPIGRGGMGSVYLAIDTRSDRHVALKVLPPKRARAEERLLARFQREMALSQRVNHPHLARSLEAGVWQGVYYIAMEYIPGKSLHRVVATQGPLDVPRAARLFMEVADALSYAHELGLIHRDLKPSNIMVTPHDHAKVLDLGLALMEGEEGETEVVGGKGYIVGSSSYIAPEQTYDSTLVDPRSDVYALGCSLYFALTGSPPLGGTTFKERIHAHRHVEAPSLRGKNQGVPLEFAQLVHRMLAKKPEDRPQDMKTVHEQLAPWHRPEDIQPMDVEGDESYLRALEEIEKSPAAEALGDFLLGGGANTGPPPHADNVAFSEVQKRIDELRRIGLAVAGICALLVLVLSLVFFLVLR